MEKKISKFTSSEIGSTHWFNTLSGTILRAGEFLKQHGNEHATTEQIKKWGEMVYERQEEISEWFNSSKERNIEQIIFDLKETLNKLEN